MLANLNILEIIILISEANSWLLVCVAATKGAGEPENYRDVPGYLADQLAAVYCPYILSPWV